MKKNFFKYDHFWVTLIWSYAKMWHETTYAIILLTSVSLKLYIGLKKNSERKSFNFDALNMKI